MGVLPMCLALFTVGCSLFEGATAVTVDTDWQSLVIDADALGIDASGVAVPAIDCSQGAQACGAISDQFSCDGVQFSCGLQCGDQGTCELFASAQESIEVDIARQLQGRTSADTLEKVELDRVVYNTEDNTLNFATPELHFFVGPQAAKLTSDSGVVVFARLGSIAPGHVPNEELEVEPAGREALARFVKNYTSPFRFLAQAEMVFGAGQELPRGKLKMKVKAYFKVDFID